MVVSIIGCGSSAAQWHSTRCDLSIGVNDCVKFGHGVDYLVVVNSPNKFRPSLKRLQPDDRLAIIKSGTYKKVFTHDRKMWKEHFPKCEQMALRSFIGDLSPRRVYSSKTSPFVAISLAYSLGATEIILWGVDMIDHKHFSPGKPLYASEFRNYLKLFKALQAKGVQVWIGNDQTNLAKHLPIYPHRP